MHPMVLLGDGLKWKLVLVRLETVLIFIQYRCMVCVERTIGSEIVWMHPIELLGDVGHVESRFSPFVGSAILDAIKVHGLCQT
jgi:hypothetical protein